MTTETYLGAACKYGHQGLRYFSNRCCVDCTKRKNDQTKEYRKEYYKKWFSDRPGYSTEKSREWKKKNEEKAKIQSRLHSHKRRQQKRDGKITAEQISDLFEKQKGTCVVCKCPLTKYQIDHILPLSKGGNHSIDNVQLLCPTCNRNKCNKDPIDFMQSKGYLL